MYRVQKAFYDDHLARKDDEPGVILKTLSRSYDVDLNRAQFWDLLTDAAHYGDPGMVRELGFEYSGLCASARATWNGLLAQRARDVVAAARPDGD